MSVIKKLYNLVKTLNINYDNKEKCCVVSTDFIRKLTGFSFITIGKNISTNILLRKMYCLRKSATLTYLYGHMYLELDEYPPYSDKNVSILRHMLPGTLDVFIDIPIALHIMIWLLGYLKILGKCYFLNFYKLKNNSMSRKNSLQ